MCLLALPICNSGAIRRKNALHPMTFARCIIKSPKSNVQHHWWCSICTRTNKKAASRLHTYSRKSNEWDEWRKKSDAMDSNINEANCGRPIYLLEVLRLSLARQLSLSAGSAAAARILSLFLRSFSTLRKDEASMVFMKPLCGKSR